MAPKLAKSPKSPKLDQKAPTSGPMIMEGSQQLLEELTSDWKRLKQQKTRKTGGVEGRVLLNLGFVGGDHYLRHRNQAISAEPRDDNKLYLMFDMIGPRMGKLLGRLSSIAPAFKANPNKKDPDAFSRAEVVDKLIKSLDHKLIQPSRTWEILWWMAVGGVAFEHVPWVPNSTIEPIPTLGPAGEVMFKSLVTDEILTEDEKNEMVAKQILPEEAFEVAEEAALTGDVGSDIFGPLNVFMDQSVKSVRDLGPDQRIHIARIYTLPWIKENFGKDVTPNKDLNIISTRFHQIDSIGEGAYLRDLIPLVQGENAKDGPQMAVVVQSYLPPSKTNPSGRFECYIPGQEILHSEPCEYGEVPVVDYHWSPVTTTFWTKDYVSSLIPPQRFINKRVSQLGEQANATIYSNILTGGNIVASDIPADKPGVIEKAISEQGNPLVMRLSPPELPTWFMESIDTVVRMFNDIAGGSDLFEESKFPGQLRGPMAVPLLQEIIDTEWGPLYEHIGERMALVKQMRLNRVKQFYPPIRTLHYVDKTLKDEVFEFHADEILRSGTDFNITIERGELMPEMRALREARVRERLQGPLAILYMDERTGRLDKSKIAADLQFGDSGRESREAQYRKLGAEMVGMLWEAKPLPPVLPFYDHQVMMDELEAAMATTEFLRASPQIQVGFTQRWEQHRQYLMLEAQAQQQAMLATSANSAIAQATQQAAAMAAAGTVDASMDQMRAQRAQPTDSIVRSAVELKGGPSGPRKQAPTRR